MGTVLFPFFLTSCILAPSSLFPHILASEGALIGEVNGKLRIAVCRYVLLASEERLQRGDN